MAAVEKQPGGKTQLNLREHPLARDERGKNLREDIRRESTNINPAARGTHKNQERSGQARRHQPKPNAKKA